MPSINRQYFMTIAEIEDAVLKQITNDTADFNTLQAALTAASANVISLYPGAILHYSYWAFKNNAGQWIGQIDVYRGESSILNHWDVALTVSMEPSGEAFSAQVSTLNILNYTQPTSPLGTFTPPVSSDGQ